MTDDYDELSAEIHRLQDRIDAAFITPFERSELMKMLQGIIDGKRVYGF
jgi:hypothetical protein